jgi:hypothetical protein
VNVGVACRGLVFQASQGAEAPSRVAQAGALLRRCSAMPLINANRSICGPNCRPGVPPAQARCPRHPKSTLPGSAGPKCPLCSFICPMGTFCPDFPSGLLWTTHLGLHLLGWVPAARRQTHSRQDLVRACPSLTPQLPSGSILTPRPASLHPCTCVLCSNCDQRPPDYDP